MLEYASKFIVLLSHLNLQNCCALSVLICASHRHEQLRRPHEDHCSRYVIQPKHGADLTLKQTPTCLT